MSIGAQTLMQKFNIGSILYLSLLKVVIKNPAVGYTNNKLILLPLLTIEKHDIHCTVASVIL